MRHSIVLAMLLGLSVATPSLPRDAALTDKSLVELRADLAAGRTTSEELVEAYLARIEAIDQNGPALHAVLALNPRALEQARASDAERKRGKLRGTLHGIPILLKDNIESAEQPTTAGSLALRDNLTNRDAPIVANLRAAGAIILGKTNLSEWANFRSSHSISGWSGLGGLTRNPHVLDRSACGSSAGSGAAIAAGLAAAAVGTETDGSIVCPAAMNGIVGVKPTLGLLSGMRIVPIAHSQDTAGPMTTTVMDAAILLTALAGKKPACAGCAPRDYAATLSSASLAGKRIGVLRFKAGRWPAVDPVYAQALTHLRAAGATLVEVELPDTSAVDSAEEAVLYAEFKTDLNAYLATTPAAVKTRTLADLIAFNAAQPRETVLFGQDTFERAQTTAGDADPAYLKALADSKRLAGPEGIDKLLKDHQLDLLVAPTAGPVWRFDFLSGDNYTGSFSTLPAVAGYPHVTVPMGGIGGLPLGLSFIGTAFTETRLLEAAYVFEQRARARLRPRFLPTIDVAGDATLPAR